VPALESAPPPVDAPESPPPAGSGAGAGARIDQLRRSPLEAAHEALGAKLVEFGGWRMPLSYPSGTLAEHRACRSGAVAFDVSHLGTVCVEGPHAVDGLQGALTTDLRKIAPGRAQYTHLLDEADGSVLDDIIVWWVDDTRFDVMPNASNTTRVREAIGGTDTTGDRAVIAVQGPEARRLIATVAPEAAAVARFGVAAFDFAGVRCLSAGTGYTGEDGVECALPTEAAVEFWDAVLGTGVAPAGLGARDTLRLEAGLPLHGHELGPGITPLQAGLGWVVGWDKGPFRGRAALDAERRSGPRRLLRGIVTEGRQPPRQGATVLVGDSPVGAVTSGNFSPVLGAGIALAFVDCDAKVADGDAVTIAMRGRSLAGRIVALPFVRHGQPTGPTEGT
jgi:aminomethyltransferase